jgi:ankyrin repeat protein
MDTTEEQAHITANQAVEILELLDLSVYKLDDLIETIISEDISFSDKTEETESLCRTKQVLQEQLGILNKQIEGNNLSGAEKTLVDVFKYLMLNVGSDGISTDDLGKEFLLSLLKASDLIVKYKLSEEQNPAELAVEGLRLPEIIRINLYLVIGKNYLTFSKTMEGCTAALSCFYQALHLAEQLSFEKLTATIFKHIDILATLGMYYQVMPVVYDYLTKEGHQLQKGVLLKLPEQITILCDDLTSQQQAKIVSQIYKMIAGSLSKHMTQIRINLSKIQPQHLKTEEKQLIEQTLQNAEQFVKHRQYETAISYYDLVKDYYFRSSQNAAYDKKIQINARHEANKLFEIIIEIRKYETEQTGPTIINPGINWQTRRERLKKLRKETTISIETRESSQAFQTKQIEYTKAIRKLLQEILQDCQKRLGKPPCEFSMLGVGSIARQALSAYSDVDIALLVPTEDDRHHPYFQHFIKLFMLQLDLLGEQEKVKPGLRIDGGDFVRCVVTRELLNTPHGFVEYFDPVNLTAEDLSDTEISPLFYTIHRPILLYASSKGTELYCDYLKKLMTKYQLREETSDITLPQTDASFAQTQVYHKVAQLYLNKHQQDFADLHKREIDLKEHYLSPLEFWVMDIALYFGLYNEEQLNQTTHATITLSIPEILDKLSEPANQIICQVFIEDIRQAYFELNQLRFQIHTHFGYQKDNFTVEELRTVISSYMSEESAVEEELERIQEKLEEIEQVVLQPAYSSSEELLERAFTKAAQTSMLDQPDLASEASLCSVDSLLDPSINYFTSIIRSYPEASEENLSEKMVGALKQLAGLLVRRNTSVVEHRNYFAKMQGKTVREKYLVYLDTEFQQRAKNITEKQEKESLDKKARLIIEVLTHYPNPDGTRACYMPQWYSSEILEWDRLLYEQFTEPFDEKQLEEYKQQKRVVVEWIDIKKQRLKRLLKQAYQPYLLNEKGEFKTDEEAGEKEYGRRTVRKIRKNPEDKGSQILAYAKAYPEAAGLELASNSLSRRISGYSAIVTLCKFSILQPYMDQPNAYPVLFSRAVPGISLQDLLKQEHGLGRMEQILDPRLFTLKFFESVLICPEDDKEDNIIAESFINEQGEIAYRLIGVDNDHAFVNPLSRKRTLMGLEEKVQLKSVMFCMDRMLKLLDEQAIEEFLSLNAEELIINWLKELEELDAKQVGRPNIRGLFKESEVVGLAFNRKNSCVSILPVAFTSGVITRIYLNIKQLQKYLSRVKEKRSKNHLELLVKLDPRLAKYYKETFKLSESSAAIRFSKLPTNYKLIEDPETGMTISQSQLVLRGRLLRRSFAQTIGVSKTESYKEAMDSGKAHGPSDAITDELEFVIESFNQIAEIRSELLEGNLERFLQLENASYLQELIINGLSFESIKHLDSDVVQKRQKEILGAMQNISFRKLFLSAFQEVLTDQLLNNLLRQIGKNLRWLDLTDCHALTSNSILNIPGYCVVLERLYLGFTVQKAMSVDDKLQTLAFLTPFPSLKKIELSNRIKVYRLLIIAPYLHYLGIKNCTELYHVRVESEVSVKASYENPGYLRINQADRSSKRLPLHQAVMGGETKKAFDFINSGAEVNQEVIATGMTTLMLAAQKGHRDVMELLLNRDADISQAMRNEHFTALIWAAQEGYQELVELLLDRGEDVNRGTDDKGFTALMAATRSGRQKLTEFLLDRGAEINQGRTKDGYTALMWAAQNGYRNIVKLLLDRGAKINQSTTDIGFTALMASARKGHRDVATLLLDRGAEINQSTTDDGRTALMIATQNKYRNFAALLLEWKVKNKQTKDDGVTVSTIATDTIPITLQAAQEKDYFTLLSTANEYEKRHLLLEHQLYLSHARQIGFFRSPKSGAPTSDGKEIVRYDSAQKRMAPS